MKLNETLPEFKCPCCGQRYWYSKKGICIECGSGLNFSYQEENT